MVCISLLSISLTLVISICRFIGSATLSQVCLRLLWYIFICAWVASHLCREVHRCTFWFKFFCEEGSFIVAFGDTFGLSFWKVADFCVVSEASLVGINGWSSDHTVCNISLSLSVRVFNYDTVHKWVSLVGGKESLCILWSYAFAGDKLYNMGHGRSPTLSRNSVGGRHWIEMLGLQLCTLLWFLLTDLCAPVLKAHNSTLPFDGLYFLGVTVDDPQFLFVLASVSSWFSSVADVCCVRREGIPYGSFCKDASLWLLLNSCMLCQINTSNLFINVPYNKYFFQTCGTHRSVIRKWVVLVT